MSVFDELAERYSSGSVPWDSELPPPEVMALAETLPPGKALDLGCGYGRASIFLARLGWQVDGVDFIPQAIAEARTRAGEAGVEARITFHLGSVVDLGYLHGIYDFALDVGCMHILSGEELQAYRDELCRLLRPGANYLLFARLRPEIVEPAETDEDAPFGVTDTDVLELFKRDFDLENVDYGQTQVEDQSPWRSAWFWFRRRPDHEKGND